MTTPQLTLYNTLTRTKEPFTPLDANNVRMYVCGPTVYDFAHIGNARPVIVFDVLFRLLRHVYGAEHVTYVRNITDVDDKINARALRDYPDLPLNDAIRKVTEKTEAQFLSDAERLGNLPPTYQPRATDNIVQMVALIQKLLDKDHAYVVRGAEGRETLFDVSSMPEYGALSRRDAAATVAGSRVEVKDHKRNPEDFVLWKESDPDEPGWDATFVVSDANRAELNLNENAVTIRGRPGWHIECSAMSERYLWDEIQDRLSPEAHQHPHAFDIHGGGLDLIFPHHENEIAQSRCAHGTHAMANVWMHNGFLQVEGQKMSKSLGNFYTISQLLDGEEFGGFRWPGEVLRFAMLMTNYREPIDFSVARLEEASVALSEFATWGYADDPGQPTVAFLGALFDDLNTPKALAELHRLCRLARHEAQGIAVDASTGDGLISDGTFAAGRALAACLALLGIDIGDFDQGWLKKQRMFEVSEGRLSEIGDQVGARLAALNAKDFARADAIRNELAEQGIALMDYKDENGERQTRWEVKR